MKHFGLIIILLLLSSNLFAQKLTPKAIDDSLTQAINKLTYWSEKYPNDTTGTVLDSIDASNYLFEYRLVHYTKEYPFTISQKFTKLSKAPVGILTSIDGMLRIYSWDTQLGGTQHANQSVYQYKSGQNVSSLISDDTNDDDLFDYGCDELHTLKVGDKTYYLVMGYNNLSTYLRGAEIRIFTIEGDTLNTKTKLIHTKSGFTHRLAYRYAFDMDIDDTSIKYDPKLKTIKFPVIIGEKVTNGVITYKFTGKYFEKIK